MKKTYFIAGISFFIVSCSSVLLTGRKQLSLVSESELIASSSQSYKQFIDSVPLSTNATQIALVKKVFNNVAGAVVEYLKANGKESEIANYQWEVNLVKDQQVNAFCMPGGKVVVYEGILPVTATEAGLAVVIGHEVAHAVAKHSNERMSQQMILQYGAAVTDAFASGAKSEATRNTVNAIYGIGSQYGIMLPYSRTHEYEADKMGLIFLAMAGYNPNEAISFWERMAASSKGAPLEIMSTHPSDVNRIEKMKSYIPEAMNYYKKK